MGTNDLDYLADKVADLILQANKVVVFTGAGVSTESGIPDFRSPGGIWSRFDPDDFTIQKFMSSRETRRMQWQMLAEGSLLKDAGPNEAHHAIAELERLGKLECVITQNIDNLHQKAGNSPEKVFELHGNMKRVRCMSCDACFPTEDILPRLEQEEVPDCEMCHGILKPDAVFFGEALPQKTLNDSIHHSRRCDLFIVIGSTLVVYPAAYMPVYAREAGAKLVIINLSSTPMDSEATVAIAAKAGETMAKVMEKTRPRLTG
ncbi:MAG: NAD-dependent deacylase [Dehalococcoidia bacterium]|nr:NAD-dependent deacylase [Dehalococcoidia bacterium]